MPLENHKVFNQFPEHIASLKVLTETFAAFLSVAGDSLPGDFCYADIERVVAPLEGTSDTKSLLALMFGDLWGCSNFAAHRWEPLVSRDASFAEHAVEACYFVLALSGASGSSELRLLLTTAERQAAARRALERLAAAPGVFVGALDEIRSGIPSDAA